MCKMNYLLVMPRFVDRVGEWYHFPLGLPYVSSSMKKAGFNVYTLNLNDEEDLIQQVLERKIEDNKIDVIVTGGLSFQYNAIKSIIQISKMIKSDITTIVGGGIITSSPEAAMDVLEFVDYGVIGEGEITNCELCDAIENNKSVESVSGIIFKKNGSYVRTKPREEIKDLDSIPYPDYKGFNFHKIVNSAASLQGINEKNAITMLSSRSCPYRCTFCFHSSGNKYRQRSLDNFFLELDYLVQEYGIKYIFIADELFAYNMERVKEFCKRIKPYNIKWWAQFRVDEITSELVQLLKDSNCVTMGFGLESADNRILKSMKKGITIEQIENALELVYAEGITIQGGFIFGDIEETIETATKTIEWWKKHLHYGITLNFITTYPGTALYNYACKEGIITDEAEFIRQCCPTINVSKMTENERAWLSELIVTLPQQELKEANEITKVKIDYENGSISFNGKCVSCSADNSWDGVRFFTRNVLNCEKCGRKHKVPILKEITEPIDINIKKLLKKYKKIAFWGINDYFSDLGLYLKELENNNVYYIDISKMKQGSFINGKIIHSPNILEKESIKIVIVPVISLYQSIKQQINENYKNVEQVISILDLTKNL